MDDSKRRVADFFRRVNDDAVPAFDRATVTFYGVQNEKILKDRTGVLLRIADTMFILTANRIGHGDPGSRPVFDRWLPTPPAQQVLPVHDLRQIGVCRSWPR